jgi:hypothetical protein
MVPGRCQEGLLGGVESREATQAVQLSLAYAGPSASAGDKSATALPSEAPCSAREIEAQTGLSNGIATACT